MKRISLADTVVISPDAVSRELGDETIILNLETGVYFGLNEVGTRVWALMEQPRQLREIFDVLNEEYDVAPEALEADLLGLVSQLEARGLLRLAAES